MQFCAKQKQNDRVDHEMAPVSVVFTAVVAVFVCRIALLQFIVAFLVFLVS